LVVEASPMLKLEMLVNIVFRYLHSGCLGGFLFKLGVLDQNLLLDTPIKKLKNADHTPQFFFQRCSLLIG
jgi:hypothetical protein